MPSLSMDDLDSLLHGKSKTEAVNSLVERLDQVGDYHQLFQSLLLKKRVELNQPLSVTGYSEEIEEPHRKEYEEAIREAARTVGHKWLDNNDIPSAWLYFRMINEPEPVSQALDRYEGNTEDDQFGRLLEIAIQENVNPARGLELVLKHYGTCNAITTLSQAFGWSKEARIRGIRQLVNKLYAELHDRVAAHVKDLRSDTDVVKLSLGKLVELEPKLCDDENYHIDISHLQSTVQFALELPGDDLARKVIELCQYGSKLSERLQPRGEPPFANGFSDYLIFFKTLCREESENGLKHFETIAESVIATPEITAPGEVLVHLLHQLGRSKEALLAYKKYLSTARTEQLACPHPNILAKAANDYDTVASIWKERLEVVRYAEAKLCD